MDAVKKANKLIGEASPYLRAHAYQPVDWFAWGKDAFEKAFDEDKPIFLSVGYSTCHWCHVMARESFEDYEVARFLNAHFVCIKVDREERPDIDSVYMRACETMTGGGGWPLSVFMSADEKPFYAGTYFPKQTFLKILGAVTEAWESNRASLERTAKRLTELIDAAAQENDESPETAPVEEAVESFRGQFDAAYGGFGGAPKFPMPHNLIFLLQKAPEIAGKTLVCMFRGGIFDHIGGGFCRYSTDRIWLVPHFEKMLYDNALLAIAYVMAFEKTERPLYRSVAERTLQYMNRELRTEDGGFFSAQDADSEDTEGKFYLFTPAEITAALGEEDSARFCARYDITKKGNFDGSNIPNLIRSDGADADVDELLPKIDDYRNKRVKPFTDTKKLTAWNALAAAAYAAAARVLKHDAYADEAKAALDFIDKNLTDKNTVFTGICDGKRFGAGFLSDYACYIYALIETYEATLDERLLSRAKELAHETIRRFWDDADGGFFFSGKANEELIVRTKDTFDGSVPSGNSVMAYNLSRLSLLCDDEELFDTAQRHANYMNTEAAAYPAGFAFYLYSALPVKKVVCATTDEKALHMLHVRSDWAFCLASGPDYPILNGETTFYVCEGNICHPPVNAL